MHFCMEGYFKKQTPSPRVPNKSWGFVAKVRQSGVGGKKRTHPQKYVFWVGPWKHRGTLPSGEERANPAPWHPLLILQTSQSWTESISSIHKLG